MSRLIRIGALALLVAALIAGTIQAQVTTGGQIGPSIGGSGTGTFVGGTLTSATGINDDLCLTIGSSATSADPCIRHDTTQTVDTGMLLTGTTANHWVIAERQDETFDFAHAQATNPTLFIHSANQSTTQWLGATHDGTNGVLSVGAGGLTVPRLFAPDGTKTAPSISGSTTTTTGFFFPAATQIIAARASEGIWGLVDGDAVYHASDMPLAWLNGTDITTASKDVGLGRHAASVLKVTNGSTGIRGLLGGGAAVASDTAMPLPTGRVFHVTGTTAITSITSTNFESGACITLIFDGVLNFTDGNNLKLASTMATTADDTISLCYDGTNWYETGRSVN